MEPSLDPGEIHDRQALTTEMAEALTAGLTPPFGGLHDIRQHVRRCEIGGVLEPEELAETVETLRAIGNLDRWLARIGDQFPRLGGLRQGVGEFSGVAAAIEGCLDSRGTILDTASRRLSALRREIGRVEERIQETLRQMLRSPEIKRILRFPNFTMVGHHYVLPVAKDNRGEIQGSVHRTSASNETVYIEPAAVGEQSAQLSFLRARGEGDPPDPPLAERPVGQVADSLLGTLETMAELDLIFARGRFSLDYRMSPPQFNQEGRLVLRAAPAPAARGPLPRRPGPGDSRSHSGRAAEPTAGRRRRRARHRRQTPSPRSTPQRLPPRRRRVTPLHAHREPARRAHRRPDRPQPRRSVSASWSSPGRTPAARRSP